MNKKTGKARQHGGKKTARLRGYRRSVLMICAVLVFLSGILAAGSLRLQAKNSEYMEQEEELRDRISEEEKRSEEVEEFEAYVKTDEYIRETAEEKLDLVDPDEIIFKASK